MTEPQDWPDDGLAALCNDMAKRGLFVRNDFGSAKQVAIAELQRYFAQAHAEEIAKWTGLYERAEARTQECLGEIEALRTRAEQAERNLVKSGELDVLRREALQQAERERDNAVKNWAEEIAKVSPCAIHKSPIPPATCCYLGDAISFWDDKYVTAVNDDERVIDALLARAEQAEQHLGEAIQRMNWWLKRWTEECKKLECRRISRALVDPSSDG